MLLRRECLTCLLAIASSIHVSVSLPFQWQLRLQPFSVHHSETIMNNTTSSVLQPMLELDPTTLDEDTVGSVLFIAVVIVWYSSSAVLLLAMNVRPLTDRADESCHHPANRVRQHLRDRSNNKTILGEFCEEVRRNTWLCLTEELANAERREKLWNIYLTDRSIQKRERIIQAETLRLQHIHRQLAIINQQYRDDRERISLNRVDQVIAECKNPLDILTSPSNVPHISRKFRFRRNLKCPNTLNEYRRLRQQSLPWRSVFTRYHICLFHKRSC